MENRMQQPEKPYFTTLEHDRYRMTVITTIAVKTQFETGQPIAEDVLMVGNDWIYLAKVREMGRPVDISKKLSIGQPLIIDSVGLYGLMQTMPLSKIIQDFYPQTEKLSLIPEGEQRIKEAKELGDIVDEQKNSFKVKYDEKEISVYKIRDARNIINDNARLPNGDVVNWTDFPSKN